MSNFETDNQDKDNLVGDAKVMSDAVDKEQADIKRNDKLLGSTVFDIFEENKELKQELIRVKEENRKLKDYIKELRQLLESLFIIFQSEGNHNA